MNVSQWRRHAMWLAVLTLATANAAGAQENPATPETRPILFGPMELHPLIAIRDVGTESYVYGDPTGDTSDFTYTISPRLHTVTTIASSRFIAIGDANLVYYRQYEDQRSVNVSIDGRYEVTNGRIRPFATGGYSRSRDRGLEIEARTGKTATRASVGTDVELSGISAFTVWVNHEQYMFGRNEQYRGVTLAKQLDHSSDTLAAGARFKITPMTTIVTAVEVQRDRFDFEPIRDADMLRIAPAVEFDTSAAISGRAQAGFRQFTPVSDALYGHRGFMGTLKLGYRFRGTHIDAQADHDIAYSYEITQPYYLQSGGKLDVSTRVAGPFEIVALAERWSARSQRVGERSFDGRREYTTSLGGGLGVHISKQLRLTFTHEKLTRTSSDSVGREYERRRTLGSLSYGL